MTQLKVDAVVNLAGSGKPNFPVSPTHSSGSALSTLNTYSYTSSGTEPSSPKNGAIWWDSSNNKVMVYINSEFKEISLNSDYPAGTPAYLGPRGFSAGGNGASNYIQYFDISAGSGNASDFGDLVFALHSAAAVSNGARIVVGGGYKVSSPSADTNVLQYWASASTGNAADFGDLTLARKRIGAAGDATRGIWAGGHDGSSRSNVMDYITIASAGNATDFGDRTVTEDYISSTNDATRSVFGGGEPSYSNTMDYVTTQTAGNATDFGNLVVAVYEGHTGVIADTTRGLFVGGYIPSSPYATDQMAYITIQTAGNATDFGNLDTGRSGPQGASNGTLGVIMGGEDFASGSGDHDKIQKVTIQTAANATDFGNLISTDHSRYTGVGASGAAS